ncbi:MAG: hypothetical protein K6E50_10855 [Lachnospiraceae bacterium]|nr:hypothetical protein [Lachnospiraceae bacterium]
MTGQYKLATQQYPDADAALASAQTPSSGSGNGQTAKPTPTPSAQQDDPAPVDVSDYEMEQEKYRDDFEEIAQRVGHAGLFEEVAAAFGVADLGGAG